MTQIFMDTCRCAVCGAEVEVQVIGSTNSFFGSPDLDLRPAEMARSTMRHWVHECPECGYVSGFLAEKPGWVTREWLETPEYLGCDGLNFRSDLAKRFYKEYKILRLNQNAEGAFRALQSCAWACDDAKERRNAARCRALAIALADELIAGEHAGDENLKLVKADLLRRSGKFKALVSEYSACRFSKDVMNDVLAFQLDLAKNKDRACYTMKDAVNWSKERKGRVLID